MVLKKKRIPFKVCISSLMVCLFIATVALNASGQQIKYEDRIGSNRDFDVCEDFRFKRITRLVSEGKLTEQQGYKIWKREQSNKAAVTELLGEAIRQLQKSGKPHPPLPPSLADDAALSALAKALFTDTGAGEERGRG